MKKILIAFFAVVLMVPFVASAADIRVNEETGNETISQNETVKNVYSFGNDINVEANVLGDFVGFGNYIAVDGDVQYGLISAGSNILINGNVAQTSRVAGGIIRINGNVGEDLLVAGGTVEIGDDAKIAGDLMVAGGTVIVNGDVGGTIKASGGQVTLNGVVAGNIDAVDVENLYIGDNAVIHGNLTYTSPSEAAISSKAQITGEVVYNESTKATMGYLGAMAGLFTVGALISYIAMFILILILTYLVGRFTRLAVERGLTKPFAMFGWGVLALVLAPIVGILLLVSVLGMQLSIVLSFVYVALVLIARPIGAILLGTAIFWMFDKKKESYRIDWLTGLVGLIVSSVLMIIPVVGWLVPFFFFALALGVIAKWSWDWVGRNR